MNTILISGTCKPTASNMVEYDVFIYGCKSGEDIQLIRPLEKILNNYSHLWEKAKEAASYYFDEPLFNDGAYTRFLDHLTML